MITTGTVVQSVAVPTVASNGGGKQERYHQILLDGMQITSMPMSADESD
ncbi:hypothetical protein KCP76_21170 [Salmonella enterica subsp. enterica serovar Weltevreden]|nr:hypothetical protein KCP76_21170 [Salmonella enterica subsp. enterica serovar Weltevreden]